MEVYRQLVPCERNSSCNFILIFLNFTHVFSMVWTCACGLDIILELLYHFFHFVRSVRVAERLALPTSDHGVAVSNPAGGEILPEPNRRFIAQSLSCSPSHRLEMTELLLKGRKTLTHPSIFPLCELCHFLISYSMEVFRQWVPCKHNSLYKFLPIFMLFLHIFMPPTSRKLWEHIGFGLFVRSSKTVHARILKFRVWIPHRTIVDVRSFSCPSFPPFWSYASLKKSEWNLMHAIPYEPCMLGFWNFIYGFLMEK